MQSDLIISIEIILTIVALVGAFWGGCTFLYGMARDIKSLQEKCERLEGDVLALTGGFQSISSKLLAAMIASGKTTQEQFAELALSKQEASHEGGCKHDKG